MTTRFESKIKQIELILDSMQALNPDSKAMCNEIIELLGDLTAYYDNLQEDLDNTTEERDELWNEKESKTIPYDNLKDSINRYNSGVKAEQETILKLLEDEFNLSLVCL